jgi:CBS domain-containing protein
MKCPFCGYKNISGVDSCESCGEDLTAFDGIRPQDSFERSLVKDTVGPIAKCDPLIVSPSTPIKEVAQELNRDNRCGLIVEREKLVGIVTIRDILQKALLKDMDLSKTPVAEIMTPNPETLNPEDKIALALNKMAIGGYRHIPIIRGKNNYGVISVRDIIGYLAEMFPDALDNA